MLSSQQEGPEDFGGNNDFGKEKEEEADHKKDDDDDDEREQQHKKKKTWIPYGTAGFRCDETAMDHIAFRCGFIAACVAAFSSKSSRKRTRASGVVVTASHNHAKDNGVKLVDGEGNVLGERYEGACEALCNATTAKELHDALDAFEEAIVEDQGNNVAEEEEERMTTTTTTTSDEYGIVVVAPVVYFGRDARESGARLVEKAKEGAKVLGTTALRFAIEASSRRRCYTISCMRTGKRWKNSLQKKKEKKKTNA